MKWSGQVIRDFVAGVVWGGVVAVLGLGVASQIAPLPERVRATAPADQAGVASVTSKPVAARPAADLKPVQPAPAQPKPAQPAPAQPEPAQPAPAQPEPAAPAPAVPEPVVPAQNEPALIDPAPLVAAQTAQGAVAAAAQIPRLSDPSPAEPATRIEPAPPLTRPKAQAPQPNAVATAPAAPAVPDTNPASIAVPDAEPPLASPKPLAQPVTPGTDAVPAAGMPPVAVPKTAEVLPDPAPVPAPAPSVITAPSRLLPDTALNEPIEGVVTGRLPRIEAAPVSESTPEAMTTATKTRLERFARPFANKSAKPLFAIVLMDTGAADLDRAQLAALPFPVSFVVDPLDPGAPAAAAIYRAGGQEVLMLATGIPAGATAADLAQTFQSHAATLPEAVAAIDLANGGFQNDRPLATQVVPVLKEHGLGLLTFDGGLNAADQVARHEDLPSATIFRNLDADDEAAPVIRRYLDRAAFKAAQDGRVVVFGQTRPETIAALLEWTVEGRASSVALAPATAVLTTP